MSEEKGDATEQQQEPETKPTPQLSDADKVKLLMLQRTAIMAQAQKATIDAQLEKAVNELNKAYQALIQQHPGYSLREDSLEFVAQ